MAVFYVLDPDSNGDGFARAAAAGRGQLAGLCGGTAVFGVCAAGPRTRWFSHMALPASAIAGIRGWHSGRNPWRGFRKLFVVGLGLIVALYLGGWRSEVAQRASRLGLGTERQLRWAIARRYQLPLGTFLGIGALAIVYGGPLIAGYWPSLREIVP